MPYRRFRREPAPPPPPPLFPAGMVDEFHARPWGFAGEWLSPPPAAPPPPADRGLVVPPADWAEEERLWREQNAGRPEPPAAPTMTAVEAMMADAQTLGELEEPDLVPGPPAHIEPVQRFVPPEPDWEAEQTEWRERERVERERLARARKAELLAELLEDAEREQDPYPAPRRPS